MRENYAEVTEVLFLAEVNAWRSNAHIQQALLRPHVEIMQRPTTSAMRRMHCRTH